MASPSVLGSYWSQHIGPKPVNATLNEVGRSVEFLEIQATSFRPDFWRCFYDLVDTEFPSGFGIDLWFYDYCIVSGRVFDTVSDKNGDIDFGKKVRPKMALIDTMYVQHNPYGLPSTHVGGDVSLQMKDWKLRKVELKDTWPGKKLGGLYFHGDLKKPTKDDGQEEVDKLKPKTKKRL
jgi:hypothetical protein